MAERTPEEQGLDPRRPPRPLEDSILRSGLAGMTGVALATLCVALVAAVIALLTALVF